MLRISARRAAFSLQSEHRPEILCGGAFAHLLHHPLLQFREMLPHHRQNRGQHLAAGAGLDGTFSLTLVTAMDHSTDHRVAGTLVAFTQGVGFIVAAIAPVVAGLARGWSGGFGAAWVMPAVCVAAMMALTVLFAPRSHGRWR
ncbi:hypothetical protein LMG27177_01898 [Paraburkholderia fynbosensis]|uniref:Uncharacterized protein n=2 Tax=Paraburkholderia fynbosensis TaxID=1200993 RepID=A0A6J5FWZ8_9BURK|nr:hypothetical protein LMG27177_01898 [Paraburkholderia fynbosensis]